MGDPARLDTRYCTKDGLVVPVQGRRDGQRTKLKHILSCPEFPGGNVLVKGSMSVLSQS